MSEYPEPDPSEPWVQRIILRTEVGSTAHGTGIPGKEDYDELGVMAMPWRKSIGIPVPPERKQTVVYRPGRADDEPSGPGDYDLVVHGARKFCSLASRGNPSILMALYGPTRFSNGLGDRLLGIRDAFWSKQARAPFLGYANAQRQRLEGKRGGAHVNRPELVEEFGYDTKYAMHMMRLYLQGIDYMQTGAIECPISGWPKDLLLSVRHGQIPLDGVLQRAEALERVLATTETDAPDRPDYERINDWLHEVFVWSEVMGWR